MARATVRYKPGNHERVVGGTCGTPGYLLVAYQLLVVSVVFDYVY